jgi:hypothetical protein
MTAVSKKQYKRSKSGIQRRMTPRLTIGVKFVSFVVLIALLAGGIVGMVTINSSRDSLRQDILINSLAQADLASDFASNYVQTIQANVRAFAERPTIRQAVMNNKPEQAQPELASLVKIQTAILTSGIYDPDGIQF